MSEPTPQITPERFADRMTWVYGKDGLVKRAEGVGRRLQNRPEVLDQAGLARFDLSKAVAPIPTMWS